MKNLLTTLLSLAGFCALSQNILLVDNTPTAPTGAHVYSTLQAAIDASGPGDIIHVKPSGTSYGNVAITAANDSISIFGIGLNADKEIAQRSELTYMYLSGKNIRISGLVFSSTVYVGYNATAGNVTLDNCEFNSSMYVGYNSVTSNVVVRNCLFNYYTYFTINANATVIANSIFSFNTTSQVQDCHNGTLISHCLFFGNGTNHNAFSNMSNSTVSNSIFYGREPNIANTNSSNTFNNCLAIHATDTVQNAGTVNGPVTSLTGNVFASTDIVLQTNWNRDWDPALAASELIGTGDDGTEIGVTGGTIPYSVTGTPLPYIKSFIVPTVIKQGEDLPVEINALGN